MSNHKMNSESYDGLDLGLNDSCKDMCNYIDYHCLPQQDSDPHNFTVLQLNIRGLLNKQDRLKDLLTDIRKDSRVTVAMLVETWLNKRNANRVKIPGYQFIGSHRKSKRGGGVGVLISQELHCRRRTDLCLNVPNFESITVEIKTHRDSIFICTVYRPPNSSVKEFLKQYQRQLKKFNPQQLERLIIGLDHNLDFIKHDKHTLTKEFINMNLDKNLEPTITKPTRITRCSATLIDNIIVGRQFQEYEANIGISDISDHLPLVMKSPQPALYKKKTLTLETRSIDSSKCNKIHNRLQEVDWNNLLQDKDANESYRCFQTKFKNILDTEAPIQRIKIQPKRILREPWMNPGLLKCVQKQKLLYKEFLHNRKIDKYHRKYKDYRNQLTKILRKTKEEYYRTKCYEFKRNTTKLWKLINKVTQRLHDKSCAMDYLKIDNINIYDTKLMSEEFAKHFSTVGTKFANRIPRSQHTFTQYLHNIPINPSSIFMKPTNKIEIAKLIDPLPNKTSKGYDEISNVLLKKLNPTICTPLEIVFNKSLEEGSFPKDMKLANVVPLFKGKERYLVNNYRPISLLVTISKILEKVVYTRTYNFLCTTDQLYQSQYGFRKGHSCENAICELVGTIAKNREEKNIPLAYSLTFLRPLTPLTTACYWKKCSGMESEVPP